MGPFWHHCVDAKGEFVKGWFQRLWQAAEAAKALVYSFDDLLKLGDSKPCDPVPPKPTDLSTIMYTSGTTGNPKGVLLTHEAIVAQVASLRAFLEGYGHWGPGDVFMSYLPLAHIFDR